MHAVSHGQVPGTRLTGAATSSSKVHNPLLPPACPAQQPRHHYINALDHNKKGNLPWTAVRTALTDAPNPSVSPSASSQQGSPLQAQPVEAGEEQRYSKGMIVRGTVEALHAGAASVLLTDGSKAKLPWESVTKRAQVDYRGWATQPPLSVGEEILAMVGGGGVRTEGMCGHPAGRASAWMACTCYMLHVSGGVETWGGRIPGIYFALNVPVTQSSSILTAGALRG